jgi:hypothetical protein
MCASREVDQPHVDPDVARRGLHAAAQEIAVSPPDASAVPSGASDNISTPL